MAAKVNVKFIGILFVVISLAVCLIGGLAVLRYRMDTSRNITVGNEAFAAGDYRTAKDMYGRAVFKDQTNHEYLVLYEKALLAIQPESRDDARELYDAWFQVLSNDVTYRSADPKSHIRLLDELVRRATLLEQDAIWHQVEDSADRMWDNVPAENPDHILAKEYRGAASAHRVAVLTEDELTQAEADIKSVLEVRPDSDVAWSSLITLQLGVADKMRAKGRTSPFNDTMKELQQTIEASRSAAPNGLRTAMAEARVLGYRRILSPDEVQQSQFDDLIERITELASKSDDRLLLMQEVQLMRDLDPKHALLVAVENLRDRIKDDPQAIFERLSVASNDLVVGKLDEAYEFAKSVIDAPRLNVGMLATAQFDLRREASRLNVDIEVRRWEQTPVESRAEQFKLVEAARAQMNAYATSQDDPLLLWADGRIALIQGDFETAASKFEAYLKDRPGSDLETTLLSARALEEINQLGLAYERVVRVSDAVPGNVQLLVTRARLEFNIGKRDEAMATLDRAEKISPGDEAIKAMRDAIATRTAGTSAPLSKNDEINLLLTQARDAMAANDPDSAREALQKAADKAPNDLTVLKFWFNVEIAAGNLDEARDLAKKALVIAPDDKDLIRVQSLLDNEDPVEAVKEFAQLANDDEGRRVVAEVINLRALAVQQRNAAQVNDAKGNKDEAAKARATADRADAEADKRLPHALELAPNDRTLNEHLFVRYTLARDWTEAAKVVDRATAADIDHVGGSLYKGRLALAQAKYDQAIPSLQDATTKMSFSSYAWRLLGMAQEGAGNIGDAQRAYQRSYECNPNDLATLRIYTTLLVRIGDATRAINVLRQAVTLLPDTSAGVEYWLGLEAEYGDITRVLQRRREMYKRSNANVTNALQLALLLGQVKPRRDLILDDNGNPKFASARWDRLPSDEQQKVISDAHKDWLNESESILADLEAKGVRGLSVVNIRARNALARDDADRGEQLLRDFVAAQKAAGTLNVTMMLTLGQYLADARRFEKARDVLIEARQLQDPAKRQADLMLGDFYFRGGRFEQAAQAYESVLEGSENPSTRQRIVECYIKTREFDKAAESLSMLKDASASEYINAMLAAAIAEGRGADFYTAGSKVEAEKAFEAQHKALEHAMELAPSQPMPHVQLAIAFLNEFKRTKEPRVLDSALNALDSAAALQADFPPISIARADVLLAQGKVDSATGELGRLLKITPESIPVRRRLIELYLDAGRTTEAGTALLEATKLFPDAAIWAERYGDLKVMLGDINAAEPMYLKAFQTEPSRQLLAKLATARLRMAPPNPRGAGEILAANPEDVDADPVLRGLLAEALNSMNKPMEALEQMRRSFAKFRQMIAQGETPATAISQWYVQLRKLYRIDQMADAEQFVREVAENNLGMIDLQWLSRFWADAGADGLSHAIELQNQALKLCPKESVDVRLGLLNDLSLFYLRSGDESKAIEVMEQLIAEQPDNAMAHNNLAYLQASSGLDSKQAIEHAETAIKLKPNDPNIMDTLGYALTVDGQYDRAEKELRDSTDIQPLSSTYLHLAELYLKTSQPRYKVENALRRAEELNPDAQTRKEINRVFDDMRKKPE